MKQCCLRGKKEKWEEKSSCFVHPAQSTTITHPNFYHREGMGIWEKKREVRKKIRRTVKGYKVKLS